MTLDEILQLAHAARRSPHARRVLHDALLERYGRAYEEILERAQQYADRHQRRYAVLLDLDLLARTDSAAIAMAHHTVELVRSSRRAWRERGDSQGNEITVVVLNPR